MKPGAPSALLIDDHAVVLQGYRSLLEQAGIAVVATASTVQEGLAAFAALRPTVVVTDLAMSGMHGLEGIGRLRAMDGHARVLVFSMHDDVVLASRALLAGATGYVTKTSPSLQLVEAVKRVAAGEPYLSPDIALKLAVHRLAGGDETLSSLTSREFECFRLIAEGRQAAEVAACMGLSSGTVANLKSRMMRKLGLVCTAEVMRLGVDRGVVRQNV